jgi:hypothetical protein
MFLIRGPRLSSLGPASQDEQGPTLASDKMRKLKTGFGGGRYPASLDIPWLGMTPSVSSIKCLEHGCQNVSDPQGCDSGLPLYSKHFQAGKQVF